MANFPNGQGTNQIWQFLQASYTHQDLPISPSITCQGQYSVKNNKNTYSGHPCQYPRGIPWRSNILGFFAVNGALRIFVSIPANESAPKSLLSDRSRRQAGIPACRRLRFGSGRLTERLVSDKSAAKSDNIPGDMWSISEHIDKIINVLEAMYMAIQVIWHETIIDTLIEGQLVKCHQIMSAEQVLQIIATGGDILD
ncbi:uncharacterized protein B0H18DRAFT_959256 [Fomitopsis serialis]|uniref:uncharacterized protein n=1 Tax=Fomitopsis serialis TaxID=139415 RepID=UPI002008BC16|nr:uncharacterized protein B0H18DRAFT_959256 [Neoantrodia serialis]KAH9915606.1 hypothetical protein B0H18DRAFT_959256 [Neoantrodia serialis]